MIDCSICATCSGSAEMRRAAVACNPSCSTPSTIRVAIRPARAPYSVGPRIRAARIVNPYVAMFMTPIAIAMLVPLRISARTPPLPRAGSPMRTP